MNRNYYYPKIIMSLVALSFITSFLSSCGTKNKIQIACDLNKINDATKSHVLYLIDNDVVHQIMAPKNERIGKVEQNNIEFLFHFPKNEQFDETVVRINRDSGALEYEYGIPPFFVFNPNNVYLTGKCALKANEAE